MEDGIFDNMVLGYNPEYSEKAPSIEDLKTHTEWVIIEFGAPWCGHCQEAQPILQEALKGSPSLVHIKILDGKGKRLGRQFGVKLWPTLILLKDGEEVSRIVRFTSREDIQHLLSNLRY